MSRRKTPTDKESEGLIHMSECHSSQNPLATAWPEKQDMENATMLDIRVRNIPTLFKSNAFSIAKASVTSNETILAVTGMNGMTLADWNRFVPVSSLKGGYISFDRVYIHIPFARSRRNKRMQWWIGLLIFICLCALAVLGYFAFRKWT
jgi:hypothetical protein